MLTEQIQRHLRRFFQHLSDAFLEADAAIACIATASGDQQGAQGKAPRTPKLRPLPTPPGPVSEVDQQRAANVLKQHGITLTEKSR